MDNVSDKNPGRNSDGWTPLHTAAENGNVELCRVIIANVSDKNPIAGWSDKTPLYLACKALEDALEVASEGGFFDEHKIHGLTEVCKLLKTK